MLIRTCRISSHPLDRSLHLAWLQLVLLVLQVALEVPQVDPLEVPRLVMALDIVTVVVEHLGLGMVLSILVVDQGIMGLTEVMVVLPLDQEVTVVAMVGVDLVDTVVHLVVSTHHLRTATPQAVDILPDHRIASPQVVHPVVILHKVLLEAIHPLDLVDRHIQDLEVLLILDLVAHLILDLAAHLILDLVAHLTVDLVVHHMVVLLDLDLLDKVVHLDPLVHHKLFNQVHPLLALIQHPPHPQQMVLLHHHPLRAQQILPHREPTPFLHQTILLQHHHHNQDLLEPPLLTLAHLAPPLHTTLPHTLLMGHHQVHTATHHPLVSLATLAILHTQHLDILQGDLPLVMLLVVLLQGLGPMVALSQDLEDIVDPLDMVDHQDTELLLDMEVLLDTELPLDMEDPLDMVDPLGTADPLGIVDLLDMADHLDIVDHPQDMVDPPGMALQDKEVIPPMATKVDQEVTLDPQVVIHRTGPLEALVVPWALPLLEATLHTIKTAMVHLHLVGQEVPPPHHNVCLHVDVAPSLYHNIVKQGVNLLLASTSVLIPVTLYS